MNETEPQGVVAMLGDAGPAPTVTHAGKTWTVGHPTQKAKGELELLVVQAAQESLEEMRPALSPLAFEQKEKRLDDRLFAREWKTFGALWAELCNGPDSYALFLCALTRQHHPGMTLAEARTLWVDANRACKLALAIVVPGFFDLLSASLPAGADERATAAARMKAAAIASLGPPTPSV